MIRLRPVAIFSKAAITLTILTLVLSGCSDSKKTTKDAGEDIEHLKGVITFQIGDVQVQRPDQDFAPLSISDKVTRGDVIRTGANSQVTIQVSDMAVVKILANSLVEVQALFGKDEGTIYAKDGKVLTKMNKLVKGQSFNVKTPTAVASVRGTEFMASVENGKSTVAVKEGKVAVRMRKEQPVDAVSADTLADDMAIDPGAEEFIGEEIVLEKGKAAEVSKEDVDKAEEQIKKTEKLKEEGKEVPVEEAKPEIKVREIAKSEELTIEKVSIVAVVPEAEKKTKEELVEIQKPVVEKEKKIDNTIKVEEKKEEVQKLIKKENRTEKEIKQVFQRIDEISLYNGRVVRGAIINRGRTYSVLTTNGTIKVPESQIKSVRVIR
jgi:hypothetical protein